MTAFPKNIRLLAEPEFPHSTHKPCLLESRKSAMRDHRATRDFEGPVSELGCYSTRRILSRLLFYYPAKFMAIIHFPPWYLRYHLPGSEFSFTLSRETTAL